MAFAPSASALITLLLLGSAAWLTQAMYEEQAGKYDWKLEQIGKVSKAQFAFRGRSRVFVATEAAVVAALDLKNGEVAWRQILSPTETVDQLFLLPRPAAVATLSSSQG